MDKAFFERWFDSLNTGLDALSEEECGRLFAPCAARCARDAFTNLYRDLFEECGRDVDLFFSRIHELDGASGHVVAPHRIYEIEFMTCSCDLHVVAHVDSPKLCECSRQSILCMMHFMAPDEKYIVTRIETVLEGAPSCRFSITRTT